MNAIDHEQALTIRIAGPADAEALDRLAALDSAEELEGEVLLAEVGGELRAAVSLESSRAVADPFHRSADLVSFLRVRAEQLAPCSRGGHRRARPVRAAKRRAALRAAA